MKIVCLSDTHTLHNHVKVPMGDVLVHAGDMTGRGEDKDLHAFASWLASQPHEHKLVICGNHEVRHDGDVEFHRNLFESYGNGIQFIHNKLVNIDGVNFYGESRTPVFGTWGWMYERGQDAEEVWSHLPPETDVLVCHGPPFGVLDVCPDYFNRHEKRLVHVGCPALARRLEEVKTKWVVCGHIHFSHGASRTSYGSTVVNASICTEQYNPLNPPLVIDTFENSVTIEGY